VARRGFQGLRRAGSRFDHPIKKTKICQLRACLKFGRGMDLIKAKSKTDAVGRIAVLISKLNFKQSVQQS
jgi:hypothetical protein